MKTNLFYETEVLEADAPTEIGDVQEIEVTMGTGECTMCECKAYEEKNALLMKCKCGHGKRFHL